MIKGKKRSSSDDGINAPEPKIIKIEEKSLRSNSILSNKFRAKSTSETTKFLKNKKGRFDKDITNIQSEKTDWRKFKQEKKDLKVKRKKAKDTYEISIEAKHMYEQLKCKKSKNKSELVAKLYNLLNGDLLKKVVMAHDTARIVQSMLKFASHSLRETISNELLPVVIEMAVSKYSHFCLHRMFKYGSPEIKNKLVDSFMGHIVRLASHKISSKILDHAYLTVATSKQKAYMRQEFFGDLYKKSKDDTVTKLSDTYKDTTHMKAAIMGSVKSNLDHVANKKLVDNSLVHAVILEYLEVCEEDKMEEIVTMYSNLIPLLLSTREGCRAAIICFWHSSSKNRRAIIKAVKEHLVKICTHEQGHVFLIAVINSMDDTKATKKAIFDTIYADLQTVASNQWGRRVIEWFISPADTNSFHPQFIKYMEEGLKYGKKDKIVRRKEIFEQIEIPIAKAISDAPEFWFSEGHIGLVTANIINKLGSTCFESAVRGLLPLVCKHDWCVSLPEEIAEAEETGKTKSCKVVAGIEDPGLHIALKKIIKSDAERKNQMQQTFGSMLSNLVTDQTMTYWLTVNRGCFILLNIIENNEEKTIPKLIDFLKAHKSNLRKQTTIGAKLLLKKLETST